MKNTKGIHPEDLDWLKKENTKSRPDLSFITSQKFNSISDYAKWRCNLTKEQIDIVNQFQYLKLPELISCAEMLYDSNIGKDNGIVFQVVSETLNVK